MSTTTTSAPSSIENPLKQLARFGQSIWLDYIRRSLMTSGELRRMVEEDGLGGMTSNPSIFEKALAEGQEYADYLAQLRADKTLDAKGIYEGIAIRDIQDAADVLRPVYARTNRRDGYVSLEVAPFLAHKTQETIDEAFRLWKTVDRPNLMIKIPGTPAGVPAIETVLREGVNVNVTLLFAQEMYEEVAWAYVRALEQRAANGLDLAGVAGVASFFVSRIDTAVDALIDARLPQANAEQRTLLESLRSKVAIANAKLAYERYQRIFSGARWEALASKGAQPQRVLWASTSTKNPNLRDVLYIEELIGKDTVNTIPPATYDAFKDHGKPRASLEEDVEGARQVMSDLEKAGISMQAVTADLVAAGVKQFEDAFTKLLAVTQPK
jgi:transaldolase/glucose-6-phosphate isomerase